MNLKNINPGKSRFFYFIVILLFQALIVSTYAKEEIYFGKIVDVKILDKLSSKNYIFKNLVIKILKCKNSKFEDNPEITSYLQVRDLNNKGNNEIFVFNGWTFSSSPSIQVFDHPIYDLWILRCY